MIRKRAAKQQAEPCFRKHIYCMTRSGVCGRVLEPKVVVMDVLFLSRLQFALIIGLICVPVAIAYTISIYWIFRGKVKKEHLVY